MFFIKLRRERSIFTFLLAAMERYFGLLRCSGTIKLAWACSQLGNRTSDRRRKWHSQIMQAYRRVPGIPAAQRLDRLCGVGPGVLITCITCCVVGQVHMACLPSSNVAVNRIWGSKAKKISAWQVLDCWDDLWRQAWFWLLSVFATSILVTLHAHTLECCRSAFWSDLVA